MDVTLRPARPEDREPLEALQRRASLAWEDDREALLADPSLIHLPVEHCSPDHGIVAESGGHPIGFAIVLARPDGDAEIDGLFVEPTEWRHGAGRALVDAAVRLAGRCGAARLWVIANARALEFYRRVGFQPAGEARTVLRRAPRMVRTLR